MKKKFLWIFCFFTIFIFTACNSRFSIPEAPTETIPETVTIDGVQYRNGFYGDLWSVNLTYEKDSYEIDSQEFHRVKNGTFDWVHTSIGRESSGVLYCAENQWEEANSYYRDPDNFTYYYRIDTSTKTISDIDTQKLEELLTFAAKNCHDIFEPNKDVKTRRIPSPGNESPEYIFYKESIDGLFTSYKGNHFLVVDDELLLIYQREGGRADGEVLVVDVPEDLSQYFVDLITSLSEN